MQLQVAGSSGASAGVAPLRYTLRQKSGCDHCVEVVSCRSLVDSRPVCCMSSAAPTLYRDLHKKFIHNLDRAKDSYEFAVTDQLRMSGGYWGLSAMEVMGSTKEMNRDEMIQFVLGCRHPSGGFGGNVSHDPHLLYTLSAIQILVILDALDAIDKEATVNFVVSLQKPDGSVAGDEWGEIDTRFTYCALNCLALLDSLDRIDAEGCVRFILSCQNSDGGFGCVPGAESHAGQVFCCTAALAICGALGAVDGDRLGWWLAARQVDGGGLNGRPEKLPDVCYSWWVLSSLAILRRLHWIDNEALSAWILQCQDEEKGGIADRPGDCADVFHTFFGLAGLSLMGYEGLQKVDPVFALVHSTLSKVGLRPWQ